MLLGDVALEDFTFMVDSTPPVMRLSIDLHKVLIDVPTPMSKLSHSRNALASNVSCKHRPEPVTLKTHRLVADVDLKFGQQVFHVPQT